MAQCVGKIAKEFGVRRCGTREAASDVFRKGRLLAIQTILVLCAQDEQPEFLLTLAEFELESFYRRVGCLILEKFRSPVRT